MRQDERIASQEEIDEKRGEDIASQIRCAMPAIVTKVNLEAQTVEVKLALQGKVGDEDGGISFVQYPILPDADRMAACRRLRSDLPCESRRRMPRRIC